MASITITDLVRDANGNYNLTFSDGTGIGFTAASELRQMLEGMDDVEATKKVFVAWWLARDPNLTNLNLAKGKTMTFDLSAAAPIKVQ